MNLSIDWKLLSIGAIELFLTLIVGIFVVFIGYKAFALFTKSIKENDELKKNNIAVGILSASIIISMSIMMKSAIDPTISTLRFLIKDGITFIDILLSLVFFIMYFLIAGVVSFIVIFLSAFIYNKLTKSIDEYAEIKNNNIAIALVLAAVLISISFLVQGGVSAIISGIQPWPQIPDEIKDLSPNTENIGLFFNYMKNII